MNIDHNDLTAQTEDRAQYVVTRHEQDEAASEDAIIAHANEIRREN